MSHGCSLRSRESAADLRKQSFEEDPDRPRFGIVNLMMQEFTTCGQTCGASVEGDAFRLRG